MLKNSYLDDVLKYELSNQIVDSFKNIMKHNFNHQCQCDFRKICAISSDMEKLNKTKYNSDKNSKEWLDWNCIRNSNLSLIGCNDSNSKLDIATMKQLSLQFEPLFDDILSGNIDDRWYYNKLSTTSLKDMSIINKLERLGLLNEKLTVNEWIEECNYEEGSFELPHMIIHDGRFYYPSTNKQTCIQFFEKLKQIVEILMTISFVGRHKLNVHMYM